MENEFRLLTLQVIGEAILSLSPEESDELFPSLYLPIMDECNARSLSPWRTYMPTPEWFAHRWRVRLSLFNHHTHMHPSLALIA